MMQSLKPVTSSGRNLLRTNNVRNGKDGGGGTCETSSGSIKCL